MGNLPEMEVKIMEHHWKSSSGGFSIHVWQHRRVTLLIWVPREDQLVSGVLLHDASTAGLAQELLGAAVGNGIQLRMGMVMDGKHSIKMAMAWGWVIIRSHWFFKVEWGTKMADWPYFSHFKVGEFFLIPHQLPLSWSWQTWVFRTPTLLYIAKKQGYYQTKEVMRWNPHRHVFFLSVA